MSALTVVLERTSRAAMPSDLAKRTVTAAARISAGEVLARAAPPAIARLTGFVLRSMMMKQCAIIAGMILLGITTTVGTVKLANAGGDEPKAASLAVKPNAAVNAGAELPQPPLAEKLDRLKTEYEATWAFEAFTEVLPSRMKTWRRPPRSSLTSRPSCVGSPSWPRPNRKVRLSEMPCSG